MDGRTSRWDAHNDARRRLIVEAAVALFDEGRVAPSLQEIGDRAGASRSVVYRQFADRHELDVAVQRHVLAGLWRDLHPTLVFEGTVRSSLRRSLATYVDWARSHPGLHRLVDADVDRDGPLQRGLDQIALALAEMLVTWFRVLGAEVSEADRVTTDPLAHGMVGLVHATVRRWVQQGCAVPDAEHLVGLMVEWAWALLDVRLRGYGLVVDPDAPLVDHVPL